MGWNRYWVAAVGGALAGFAGFLWNWFAVLVKLEQIYLPRAIAQLAVSPQTAATTRGVILGLAIYLAASAALGTIFALLAGHDRLVLKGVIYGIIVWLVIPNLAFPFLGLARSSWSIGPFEAVASLIGNLLYGSLLGDAVSRTTPVKAG